VRELFVGETEVETGKIIRGYRLENGRYQPISVKKDSYFSEVVGQLLPKRWPL
jgi:hypothetical protein